jgi:hypothetical protein
MGNGTWTAGFSTGQWSLPRCRFAGRTAVFYLFSVLFGHSGDRLLPKRIILILSDFKDTIWAGCHTVFTAIAFICIDNDEVLA